jgi:hypothetical protein
MEGGTAKSRTRSQNIRRVSSVAVRGRISATAASASARIWEDADAALSGWR